jgi:hypothetical protein
MIVLYALRWIKGSNQRVSVYHEVPLLLSAQDGLFRPECLVSFPYVYVLC